ncbi:sterol desaturase family protein [Azospirillum sp. SYSU D00513]|uniref:sterol desaturase family protein n=1 Tax=Azospirillum sp. SYSU D00513 TaxID=2812561 RepID=UPI001A95B12D|nr:sterol desaturase family protein [Azospirillum sp. SYSU D00513]
MAGRTRVSPWLTAGLAFGAFGALLWMERRRPLRREVEPRWRHDARNLAVAAVSTATLQIVQKPVIGPLAELVEERRWGLLKRSGLPPWAEIPLAVLAMDYTLYLWHVLTHRVPWLWRLHRVHHADLDLTATTALRFHAAEMALSVPWRAAQILLIGVGPRALGIWQKALLASILFHHANLRLPPALERRLVAFIVTPRMHGIHHSDQPEEADSNWSSGLTLWDRLHGTLRLDVPQEAITIGVHTHADPAALTLPRLLGMPFEKEPEAAVR